MQADDIALMAFVSVWGLGNVVNNYAQQGLTVVVSWLLIMALYFVPYALSVGQLGSTFKESSGGVSSWIKETSTKRLAFFAAWTYWVVHVPYLAQKPQGPIMDTALPSQRHRAKSPTMERLFKTDDFAATSRFASQL